MADWDTLLNQAWKTADTYMAHGRRCIDETFGEGYAEKHPELLAAFMNTSVRDFHTAAVIKVTGEAVESFAHRLEELASALRDRDE